MATRDLKDKRGRKIGEIRTYVDREEIFNINGRRLGYYSYRNHCTYKSNGSKIGEGNLLAALLFKL